MAKDKAVVENITLGMQMGITIAIFVYGGFRLDEKFAMSPIWVIVGMVLGISMAFYQLMKEVKRMDQMNRERKESNDSKKTSKWM